MRFSRGVIIAGWKLNPIPRQVCLKYQRAWQFLTVSFGTGVFVKKNYIFSVFVCCWNNCCFWDVICCCMYFFQKKYWMYLSCFNYQVSVLAKKLSELDGNGLFKKRIGIGKTHHGSTYGKNPHICCFLPGTLGGAGEYKKGIFSIPQNSFCAQL